MKYNPALDGLRALAVLLVLGFHARAPLLRGGFIGVDVFFVLSGYLITSILREQHAREGRLDLRGFYVRRVRRLYPALLAMLAVMVVAGGAFWPHHSMLAEAALAGLYLSNYSIVLIGQPFVLSHTWSLSVEEQFYLLWPVAVLLLLRSRHPVRWLVGAYVLACAWRLHSVGWVNTYVRFDTHATGLILGGILAFVRFQPRQNLAMAGLGCVTLLAALLAWRDPTYMHWGLPLAELCAAAMVVGANAAPWLASPALVWMGKRSYGVYLWHFPLMRLVRDDWPWWQTLPICGGLALVLASISYATVERYFRRQMIEPLPSVNPWRARNASSQSSPAE